MNEEQALANRDEAAEPEVAEIPSGARLHAEQQALQTSERAVDRMAHLQAIISALSESPSPDQAAQVIVEQGIQALQAGTGTVALLTPEGSELEILYSLSGSEPVPQAGRRCSVDTPILLTEAICTRQPIWTSSPEELRERFPLLTSEQIETQAFAVVPLSIAQNIAGSLCFGFPNPRSFDSEDREFLLTLGRLCAQAIERARLHEMAQIEARERSRTEQELLESERRFRAYEQEMQWVLAGAHCLLWYAEIRFLAEDLPLDWRLWFPDVDAARRYLDVTVPPGQSFVEVWHLTRPEEDRVRIDAYSRQEILAGRSYHQQYRYRRSDGELCWLAEAVHVEQVAPEHWRAVGVCTDITELKSKEQVVQALNERLQRAMTETHHRVKNNLQVISALIEIQTDEKGQTVPASALRRVRQHIGALAGIHDLLTREARTVGDAQCLSIKALLGKLIPLVQGTLKGRHIRSHIEDLRLPLREGTALALLVNELVSNAIKYAAGDVELTLTVQEDTARLEVCDDGAGFPPDFDARTAANIGLELVDSIGRLDLQGQVAYDNREQGGGRVVVTFPLPRSMSEPQRECNL